MPNKKLILTEHAIKRHAKRLQIQMKNYNQELSLGESQNFLSKILGFNNWNHLHSILQDSIKHDDISLNSIKNQYSKCAIISNSDLISKTIALFLNKSPILGTSFVCEIFSNIESFQIFLKNHQENFDFLICDSEFININLNENLKMPIIYLVNETKEEVFYKLILKLFFTNKFHDCINELKIYLNKNKGHVDSKFWNLLLSCYKKISDQESFDKLLLIHSEKFPLDKHIDYHNFSFTTEHCENNYFLSKPFSKDDLFKTISFFHDY